MLCGVTSLFCTRCCTYVPLIHCMYPLEFCVFVAGWRHALRSEWPFIIMYPLSPAPNLQAHTIFKYYCDVFALGGMCCWWVPFFGLMTSSHTLRGLLVCRARCFSLFIRDLSMAHHRRKTLYAMCPSSRDDHICVRYLKTSNDAKWCSFWVHNPKNPGSRAPRHARIQDPGLSFVPLPKCLYLYATNLVVLYDHAAP